LECLDPRCDPTGPPAAIIAAGGLISVLSFSEEYWIHTPIYNPFV